MKVGQIVFLPDILIGERFVPLRGNHEDCLKNNSKKFFRKNCHPGGSGVSTVGNTMKVIRIKLCETRRKENEHDHEHHEHHDDHHHDHDD